MKIEEMIAVMTAYKEGKRIQCKSKIGGEWEDILFEREIEPISGGVCVGLGFNTIALDYRIKPEPKQPKYRPYKDADECFADVQKHGGWIKGKNSDFAQVTYIADDCIYASHRANERVTFASLAGNWADDGSVCGVLEEE